MSAEKGSNAGKGVTRRRTESWGTEDRGECTHTRVPLITISESSLKVPFYRRVTAVMLPDNVLLEIFNFYLDETQSLDGWHPLVHVCRSWRHVVFSSPRRLNLRLYCTERRPVRTMLNVWPALPIVIWNTGNVGPMSLLESVDNIIAALEHNDRVYEINLGVVPGWLLERLATVMQEPFPVLTSLALWSDEERAPVPPDSFSSGSAPRLRSLRLDNMPFPIFRRLPLVASDLVDLRLWDIPDSGYISPEAMVDCLAALTKLQTVDIEFHSPRSRPNRTNRRPPPLTRVVLPALASCRFQGVSEYLEDFVAQIDVPLLNDFAVTFFHQLIFSNPKTLLFISRAENIKIRESDQATVVFSGNLVVVRLSQHIETVNHTGLSITISCTHSDWQLSALAQVCVTALRDLSTLERLEIREERRWPPIWHDDMEMAQWLELLQPFTAVKDLYLSKDVALRVAPFLQELTRERVVEVLPSLKNLLLEEPQTSGPIQEAIGHFVTMRHLNGHSVTIHNWERGKGPYD